eukprot:CAMPEP_0172575474 /NCGR_PEP_ID=MMETSP1067-20121228/137231_1 /TAXON_ID=265564 ORGANISM="Thalassiosira punctigera, Strain Tpunct2005C2" /NCGR_SAMPLE_ID=MMETSP1067 /ASSEMBLY_ACC=CAM_ASM_000444 /LENGTH=459 /DNA_ID=CAMNT_0013368125 /DNA_START=150 /DNA_END=1525 /DNA_ORIENTATION=-
MALLRYTRPPQMSEDELQRLLVPLDRVETDLPAVLEEHGVGVVTGVVGLEELAELEKCWCEDLRRAASPGERRRFEEAGGNEARRFPLELANRWTHGAGFALEKSLMHGDFSWSVRKHPNVHRAFAALFEDELRAAVEAREGQRPHLVSSLDVPFFSPGDSLDSASVEYGSDGAANKGLEENLISAHVDQNPHDVREGLGTRQIYQGALYIWPATSPTATATVVWPGSHRATDSGGAAPSEVLTDDLAAVMNGAYGSHYCSMGSMSNRDQRRELVEGWKRYARIVPVPAGGLLLWNSRTVHSGWGGSDEGGGARLAQAVCLEPASRRPERERVAKLRLCALGLPSTHWASVGMQHDMVLYGRGWLNSGGEKDSKEGAEHGASAASADSDSPPGLPVCVDWEKAKQLGGVAHVGERLESLLFKGHGSPGFYLTGMWDHQKSEVDDIDTFLQELIKPEYQA